MQNRNNENFVLIRRTQLRRRDIYMWWMSRYLSSRKYTARRARSDFASTSSVYWRLKQHCKYLSLQFLSTVVCT